MKKKNLVPLLGIAFIVAVVSTGIFYGLFVGKLNSATPSGPGVTSVVIATHAIETGALLGEGDVKVIPWVAPGVPAGAIGRTADAVGKVATRDLAANELVRTDHLGAVDGGDVDGGSLGIPDGMRAVSLQVQDSAGVVTMLRPGLKVDVQVVGTIPGTRGNEPHLRTVLENVPVLRVPKDGPAGRGGTFIVTVLASPEDAALLGLADSSAKVRLLLRNPIDQKVAPRGAVGMGTLFQQPQETVDAKGRRR
jgi:pilus assembly protein CpaB